MHTQLITILAQHALRITKPRQAVFSALADTDQPMAIGQVIKACPDIDRVSVYRTLETFTGIGVAQAVPFGWRQRYELAPPFKPHHHHITCKQCGTTTDIHNDQLEKIFDQIAIKQGFSQTNHTFEITGICQKCTNN